MKWRDGVETVMEVEKELCVFLSLVFICWGLTDSIQGPFYPIEAVSKADKYGPVFGIIHLAIFISSPVLVHYLPHLSLRAVLGFGPLGTSSLPSPSWQMFLESAAYGFSL